MCFCVQVVPFRETPSYTKRRRVGVTRTTAGNGLSSPRSLIRSASDNALESPASSPGPSLQSLETHHDTHTHSLRRHTRRLRYEQTDSIYYYLKLHIKPGVAFIVYIFNAAVHL